MEPRTHLRVALAIAAMVHAAAFVGVGRDRDRAPALAAAARVETEVGIELGPDEPSPPQRAAEPPAATAAEPPAAPAARLARGAPAAASRASEGAPGAAPGAGEILSAPESSTPANGEGWTFSPIMPGSGPAGAGGAGELLADATRAGVRAMLAEEEKKKPPARAPVFPRYTARDVELGLAPGGHLLTLAREEVRRSLVPDISRALLEFTTDSAGIVAAVRVLEVSSGGREWNEVAADLLASSAREKPVRVPAGTKGLTITMEVSSSLKTISGATPSSNPIAKVWGAVNNPLDTIVDSKAAPRRVVAGRVVAVDTL